MGTQRFLHPSRLRPIAALALSLAAASWLPLIPSGEAVIAAPATSASAQASLRGSQGTYAASVFVAAPAKRAWNVLTNYEAMAGVMPDIKEAKVLQRNGNTIEVLQVYQAPYTFGRRIKATLSMRENAPRQLSYQLIQGDQIKTLQGSWSITAVRGGVELQHQLKVDPVVPGFVRPLYFELMEANLRQSMGILKRLMEQPS